MNSQQNPQNKRPNRVNRPTNGVANRRQPSPPPPPVVQATEKRGISGGVILLLILAVIAVVIVYTTLTPKQNSQNQTGNSPSGNITIVPPPNSESTPGLPMDTPIPETNAPEMKVQTITETFPSGSYVTYGYPSVEIEDDPTLSEHINNQLHTLVDSQILPMIEQLRMEDVEGYLTSRTYSFRISAGSGFYSVVVTLETNEGITSGKSIFSWNFFADTGNLVPLRTHCTDLYRLAVIIDGCIENITSYDQIIHAWLKDILTAEEDSDEFSFYFENETMVAVLNNNLRLNSFDRDPILVKVPYEKIVNIFPTSEKE